MKTVSLKKFLTEHLDEEVLVDIDSCPYHVRMDYIKRNENIINGKELCEECDGTGNEFMSMYKQCEACWGSGIKQEITKE